MIRAMALLLCFQLVGEIVVRLLVIPFPGPVMGMLLLFAALKLRGSIPDDLKHTAQEMLNHLSLLFVPAAVGIMVHFSLIQAQWLPILAALTVGTFLTIAVTAFIPDFLLRRKVANPPVPPSPSSNPEQGEMP